MSRTHRLFFALEPEERVRRDVIRIQRGMACAGRAVRPEQLHVTLAFLGNQPSERIGELVAVAAGLEFEACAVTMDVLGGFRRARVAWLGASEIPEPLLRFRESLAEGLAAAGFRFDHKPFKFHLTLYRHLRKPHETMRADPVIWKLTGFSLLESVSLGNGVRYDRMGHWNRAGQAKRSGSV